LKASKVGVKVKGSEFDVKGLAVVYEEEEEEEEEARVRKVVTAAAAVAMDEGHEKVGAPLGLEDLGSRV
jgi:hypothetical protein